MFGVQIWKFLLTLPSITDACLIERNKEYEMEYMALGRFVTSMLLCFARLMTNQKEIPVLQDYVHWYMDCMVEFDTILTKSDKGKKLPNFVKSNSLGILSCTSTHQDMGPALLHWEGGWEGERKIQQLKPLLSIKRSNTDWTRIALRKIHQHNTLVWMLDNLDEATGIVRKGREFDSMIRIYKNRTDLMENCSNNNVLIGILGKDGCVWIGYRPVDEESGNTRVQVKLSKIDFSDENGGHSKNGCWFAPITLTNESQLFDNMESVARTFLQEVVLLLPQMSVDSSTFMPKYYCIGHLWTERQSSGKFIIPITIL